MRKPLRPLVAVVLCALAASSARGQAITEGFDNVAGLTAAGWSFVNNSTQPFNAAAWRQGSDRAGDPPNAGPSFAPQSGGAGSYARSDFTATGVDDVPAIVSDWMILPTRTLNNGDVLTYYTRTSDGNAFPERLTVRLSTSGASGDVGTTETSVGDFTTVLQDINPAYAQGPAAYPDTWTFQTVTISGLAGPTLGRIAFHHFVEDSGPAGANGNQIGIDTLTFTPVPEPAGLLALGAVVAVAGRRLSRRLRPAAAPASPESRPG